MKYFYKLILLCIILFMLASISHADSVILLHGIARTSASLTKLEEKFQTEGYAVLNLNYPARDKSLEDIVEAIHPQISQFLDQHTGQVHFVTHSMGGLVARAYLSRYKPQQLGRVVMLAPPNQGSEVADFLASNLLYKSYFGPAGQQLITSQTTNLKNTLGTINYPLGVIAGDRSINLISSWLLLPSSNDGKVSVSSTKIEGMTEHIVIHATHPFLMSNPLVINQTVAFIKNGKFDSQ